MKVNAMSNEYWPQFRSCYWCKFFEKIIADPDERGECHRHAPHAIIQTFDQDSYDYGADNGPWGTYWPRVDPEDWCGEWQQGKAHPFVSTPGFPAEPEAEHGDA